MRPSVSRMCDPNTPSVSTCGLSKKRYAALSSGPLSELRKRALQTLRQPTRECDESLRQARVAQIRRAELVARPIVKVIGARQCGTSLSMKLREVNIVCRGLQA